MNFHATFILRILLMRIVMSLLFLLYTCGWARCADEKSSMPEFRMRMYQVPPNFFKAKIDSSERDAYATGVKAIPSDSPELADAQFDTHEFFERFGLKFAPGEEALFQPAIRTLLIRAKPETLEVVESLGLRGCFPYLPFTLRFEVSLVEFASANAPENGSVLSFAALRKAAGNSWHILNQMTVTTKSGQRVLATSKTGVPDEKQTASPSAKAEADAENVFHPLRPGESGVTMELEPVLGPDGRTTDFNLHYSYRALEHGGFEWAVTTGSNVLADEPTILQIAYAPEAAGTTPQIARALVVRSEIILTNPPVLHPVRSPNPFGPP